ncbi:hypothetical protein [Moraxella nonliquefaciens]|uniref:Uncharacterized protein n=1 Tax=Moraxella nonliquefaciens TaxID=478 RepID=A0A1B8PKY2_MORNO|nr:hypothetical protein [Moraxella nonliquefaciens]OBX51694.1 hypothetical protein A9Z60_06750 [Moraxella nonliquefaciens]
MKYLLCINNKDYPASLEAMKLYHQIHDPVSEKLGMVRIIDESGEDYLYSQSLFIKVPAVFSQSIDKALTV